MRILGIETSSRVATAAILEDGEILAEYTLNHKKTHSQIMQPAVEKLLTDVGLSLSDIDIFACGIGPGSFTGLRIGVSMIKGFAQALSKPTAGVSTLLALAQNVKGTDKTVVSLIYARADEVFYGIYDRESAEEGVCTIDELLLKVKNKNCIFVGDGAVMFKEKIEEEMGKWAAFGTPWQNMVSGANVCILAKEMADGGKLGSYSDLSPSYMRPSQAEREFG